MDVTEKITTFFAKYPARAYDAGQLIARAEEELPGIMWLANGSVSQYDIAPNGSEVVVNVYKPGAFFPMSWAINRTPNHYFFEAFTDVTVRVAPPDDVVAFVKDNPDILFDLLIRVYRGTDGLLRRMAHLMGGDARSRLIFELLNASYRFGRLDGNDDAVHVPLSETELAKRSGLTRETINRTLRSLKETGLVSVEPSGVVIQDVRALEALLGDSL